MPRHRRSPALLLLGLLAAGPLFASPQRDSNRVLSRSAVEVLTGLWHRLVAVVAPLGPEADPTGTPAPVGGRSTAPATPPPADLGPEMDPTG